MLQCTLPRYEPVRMQTRYVQPEIQITAEEGVIEFVRDIFSKMTRQRQWKVQKSTTDLRP
jgi:hypothetical protein